MKRTQEQNGSNQTRARPISTRSLLNDPIVCDRIWSLILNQLVFPGKFSYNERFHAVAELIAFMHDAHAFKPSKTIAALERIAENAQKKGKNLVFDENLRLRVLKALQAGSFAKRLLGKENAPAKPAGEETQPASVEKKLLEAVSSALCFEEFPKGRLSKEESMRFLESVIEQYAAGYGRGKVLLQMAKLTLYTLEMLEDIAVPTSSFRGRVGNGLGADPDKPTNELLSRLTAKILETASKRAGNAQE